MSVGRGADPAISTVSPKVHIYL